MAAALPFAFGAVGSLVEGSGRQQAANVDAANAETNAALARQDAKIKAEDIRRQGAQYVGAAKAGFGTGGVQQSGSVNDVLFSSAYNSEVDAQRAIYQGEATAIGYQGEAASSRARGQAAATSGFFKAASSVVAGYNKAHPPRPTSVKSQ